MDRLKGKVVVVTGSSRGLGKGLARCFAREGAAVVLSGRNEADGRALESELRSRGTDCFYHKADVSKVQDCFSLVDKAVEAYGRIDGLVNNAGIFPEVPMLEMDEAAFDAVMAVNVKGSYFCTQRTLRYMTKQKQGSIVNIGSTHYRIGAYHYSAYGMSKGALHTMSQHVGYHYAPYGIRSNWVTVGWVVTEGELSRVEKDGRDLSWLEEQGEKLIPSGKLQTCEDIANACIYLLSDESKQVTGSDIDVTGGFQPVP